MYFDLKRMYICFASECKMAEEKERERKKKK